MVKTRIKKVPIKSIITTVPTQQRRLEPMVVARYVDLIKEGVDFPPIEVVFTGHGYIVWDGFHRLSAVKKIGRDSIVANERLGNERDAIWLSMSANSTHGLQRHAGDIRAILELVLKDVEWGQKPIGDIAKHVGCSRRYAQVIKKELYGSADELVEPESTPELSRETDDEPDPVIPKSAATPRSPMLDGANKIIPASLQERWLSRVVLEKLIQDVFAIRNQVLHSIEGGDLTFALLNHGGFNGDVTTLIGRMKSAVFFAVCLDCKGDGCTSCHSTGFMNKKTYEMVKSTKKG